MAYVIRILAAILLFCVAEVFRHQELHAQGSSSTGAIAGERVALVIGNSRYQNAEGLPNTKNDAADVAAALKRLGFKVTLATDLDYGGMRASVRQLGREAAAAEMALFYFAGHGFELDGVNYLVPVDARIATRVDVEYETLPLDLALTAASSSPGFRVIVLDACRNNPFASKMSNGSASRSLGRGLAPIEPANGTLVAYAAKGGTTAADGRGRNSPFTAALLDYLEEPGLDVQFLFRKVRDRVLQQTAGLQEPFTYGSLPGLQVYLKPPTEPGVRILDDEEAARELSLWNAVKESADPRDFESYLERFPSGTFASLARARIAALTPMSPSDHALVVQIQRELTRVGCNPGPVDGVWGGRTKRAATEFSRRLGLAIEVDLPQSTLLNALSAVTAGVCPPTCSAREELRNGACVEKRCSAGRILTSNGQCVQAARPVGKAAKSAPPRAAAELRPAVKTCRLETRDECRARARAAGAVRGSGFCSKRNRIRVCN